MSSINQLKNKFLGVYVFGDDIVLVDKTISGVNGMLEIW